MKTNRLKYSIIIGTLVSVGTVIALFLISEKNIHRNNSFIRRVLPHVANEIKSIDLTYNSYYIAGMTSDKLYLGNTTAPLSITEVSLKNYEIKRSQINLDQMTLPFRSVRIEVKPPNFYVADGNIPIIFKGKTRDWYGETISLNAAYFSIWTTIDSTSFGLRTLSSNTQEQVLGTLIKNRDFEVTLSSELLTKQVDGYFDVDGQLLWNPDLQRFIYVYYYRNEYLIYDSNLHLDDIRKTIDTIQLASLKVADLNRTNQKKLLGQPIVVNKMATTDNQFLFIISERLGKYEPKDILEKSTIIDVYNLENDSYRFSFYTFHDKGAKSKSIRSYKNLLAIITDNQLHIYNLKSNYFK